MALGLVSLGPHCFLQLSSARLIVALVPGFCSTCSAFSAYHTHDYVEAAVHVMIYNACMPALPYITAAPEAGTGSTAYSAGARPVRPTLRNDTACGSSRSQHQPTVPHLCLGATRHTPPAYTCSSCPAVAAVILNHYFITATKAGSPEVGVAIPTASPASLGMPTRPLRTARPKCVPEATSAGAE